VVELPGSLAVRATAELHRRARSGPHSVDVLQRSLLARVRSQYRLPPEIDASRAAEILAEQTGADAGDIVGLLTIPEAHVQDHETLERAEDLDRIGRQLMAPTLRPSPTQRTTDV
jgi:hypothetical protein